MLSYEPDRDPMTPGIVYAADNLVPTLKGGMRQGFITTDAGDGAPTSLAGEVIGSFLVQLPSGGYRMFVATRGHKLYDYGAGWVDRSRTGGYNNLGSQVVFDQLGESTIAVDSDYTNTIDYPQVSTTSGAFSNVSGAPKCHTLVVSGNALFLFNLNRGGVSIPDGWHRSDTGNIANWIPEADGGVGEAAYGQFSEVGGPIVAATKRGEEVLVFKRRGMWRGRYVGLPDVMDWEFMGAQFGALGAKAVINVEDAVYFAAPGDIFRYDGSRPVSITMDRDGSPRINSKYVSLVRAQGGASFPGNRLASWGHDDELSMLYFMHDFAGTNSSHAGYLAYNYSTGAWGIGSELTTLSGVSNGGGIGLGSFLNAPGELVRSCAFFAFTPNPLSTSKSACICFGLNGSGAYYTAKWFRDGFSTGAGATVTWQMSWTGSSAKQGGQVKRIYPIFTPGLEYQATDTLTATVTGFRNRGGGPTQSSKSGTFGQGQIDVLASGTMFKVAYTATPAAVTSTGFELLAHEMDFAETSAPKHAVGA